MSIFNDKTLKGVADVAAKIMEAELSAKQKAIAKLAEPKHKIDSGDLAKLRAGHKPVNEHSDDDTDKYGSDKQKAETAPGPKYGIRNKMKEEAETELDESLQKTVDYAQKHGYTAKRSPSGNSMTFHNKEIGHKVTANLSDKGKQVNFHDHSSGMSGNDEPHDFHHTFKQAHQDAQSQHSISKKRAQGGSSLVDRVIRGEGIEIDDELVIVEGKSEVHKVMTKAGNHIGTIRKMPKKESAKGLGSNYEVVYHPQHHEHGAQSKHYRTSAEEGKNLIHSLHKSNVSNAKKQLRQAEQRMKSIPEETQSDQNVLSEATYSAKAARAGKDIGKPGKMFAKIAKKAEASGARSGEAVAGAVLKKLRMKEEAEHEDEAQDKAMCKDVAKKEVKKHEKKMHGVNESFTEMIAAYQEEGLKSLSKLTQIDEEPDNEQFTKELKDQEASMMGKKKQPSVAAPATMGVKTMPEEVEVIDLSDVNEVKEYTINLKDLQERTLTEPETKKKEEVVKSMKKKLPGFKERYGERAKSVIYATATKIAKEKA